MWWIFLGVVFAYWFYAKFIAIFSYWRKRNVVDADRLLIFGDLLKFLLKKASVLDLIIINYKKFSNKRYYGTFSLTNPVLIVHDIDLIKKICVKDFDHFTDHSTTIDEDVEPMFSKNLMVLTGDIWRDMRATLSPAFTSSKMRGMVNLINECSKSVVDYFVKQTKENGNHHTLEVEMKDAMSRFTNDVIASVAFGIKCDSLSDKDNEFFKMGQYLSNVGPVFVLKFIFITFFKTLTKIFNIRVIPKASDFFSSLITKTIKTREEINIVRPDILHLLIESRKGRLKYEEDNCVSTGFSAVEESVMHQTLQLHRKKLPLNDLDIAAQALLFFVAGFETVSTLLAFLTYELAVNPAVQEKLYQEIQEELCENETITYEQLPKFRFLDMIVSETLRKWPPQPTLDRICVKNYKIAAERPEETDFVLEAGRAVTVPVLAIHRDENYYPDPSKFDPERFSEENRSSLNSQAYMPFGLGPRNCIGCRFALMETKIITINLVKTFEFVPVTRTCIPMVISPNGFKMAPKGGFWLGLKLRKTE